MKEFFTKYRIWYLVTFLLQIIPGILIFTPHFSFVDPSAVGGSVEILWSAPDFYEAGSWGSIYSTTMIIYFFATAPLLIGGFSKKLGRWPLVFSLVIAGLYSLLNALWFTLILIAGTDTTETFAPTLWFFVYIVIQLGVLANLIALIVKLKPVKEIKKNKRWSFR